MIKEELIEILTTDIEEWNSLKLVGANLRGVKMFPGYKLTKEKDDE